MLITKNFIKNIAWSSVILLLIISRSALASYPDKPIRIIVPYAAGGDSDLTTRVWASAMEKELGNPMVVINKPGGSGVVGTTEVVNSKKDGYTLVNAGLGNVLIAPNYSKTSYNIESFTPIIKLSSVPLGIVVSESSPYKNFDDFVVASKDKTLTQGSFGAASSGTVLAKMISSQMQYKQPRFVHANNGSEAVASVLGGHVDSAVAFPPSFDSHVAGGRARVLIINERMEHHSKDIPLFSDYGIEGDFEGWSGIFAPKGVPEEVVETLVKASEKVMSNPEVLQAMKNLGVKVDFRHGESWINELKENNKLISDVARGEN